jgi:hypothetical protein
LHERDELAEPVSLSGSLLRCFEAEDDQSSAPVRPPDGYIRRARAVVLQATTGESAVTELELKIVIPRSTAGPVRTA